MDHDFDLDRLTQRLEELGRKWQRVANDPDIPDVLEIIRKPGWTTPAEFVLVQGIVEVLHQHTQTITELKQVLVEGSRRVEVTSE
jgi:hypothetical protein